MNLNDYARLCHEANKNWWVNVNTGDPIIRNRGELIALMHSELSEALEGVRKNLMDDKLPHRKMEEVELADLFIRLGDYVGAFGLDLQGAFDEKMEFNKNREDHKLSHRKTENGKKF